MAVESSAAGDQELVTKTLQIEHKLFYLDLKENPRGRYLKISEKTSGARSTIIVPIAGVVWFVDLFNYYANGDDNDLSSKELQLDTKVFYFDVGENPRGRFLKVSEASVTRSRSTIIVPAGASGEEGWASFRNALVEVHEASQALPPPAGGQPLGQDVAPSFAPASPAGPPAPASSAAAPVQAGDGAADGGLNAARVVRAEQKKFFFDLGSNARGQFLRISEVTGADRSAIILPASSLEQFHETLGQFVEMVKSAGISSGASVANVRTIAPPRKRADGGTA
ncbi:Transcriptional regulator of the PUR family [Klebsormidium nitens]|uniref:Transcriptional regulator of the PUR family n=1 Tax=Klebsormidium nitens TaxID=105231 RepID=A0A1Y1IE99_KLENI|nr:Transcriptional regulator of the PUR family [Klebsormidium nitens]|eukprot:GAQ87739.1 Transcriptional regulator of the PUR family [Klebsormidium nitens]